MQHVSEYATSAMRWEQPSRLTQAYVLRADEQTIATLELRSDSGSFATAQSADGCWTFKRVGFWKSRATIRTCGDDHNLAVFQNDTWHGGGTLTLADGQVFHLTTNSWQTRLDVLGAEQQPLLNYVTEGWFKMGAQLSVTPAGRALDELPLLVLFGWYIVVMLYQDTAAVSAATASFTA